MLQYNPTVTGSLQVSGDITGTVNGINITGLSQSVSTQLISVQVSTGSSDAKFETLSGVTSSALTRLTNIESKSASVDISISNINSITASNIARLSNLETKSSSVDISISNINSFTSSNANTSLNSKTGSYATTGSNTFIGTQIISGSTYVQGDLVVLGSSSIQYISASSVSIGTNIVQLNTSQPAVRFGGLSVQDSGSAVGVTGSMFWDGCCNRWIYSNPSGVGYSGGVLMSGPRGSTLGNEPTLTCNYIAKSGGGDHLYDSCIIDDGTTVCVNANLKGSGQVCSLMGNFSCVGIGTQSPSHKLVVGEDLGDFGSGYNALVVGCSTKRNGIFIGQSATNNTHLIWVCNATTANAYAQLTTYNYCNALYIDASKVILQNNNITGRVGIGTDTPTSKLVVQDSNPANCFCSIAVFGNSTPAPRIHIKDEDGTLENPAGIYSDTGYGTGIYNLGTGINSGVKIFTGTPIARRLWINCVGIATFSCQVCALGLSLTGASDAVLNISAPNSTAYITFKNACNSIWGIGSSFIGRTCNLDVYNFSTSTNALTIDKTGVACFGSTVCSAGLVYAANGGCFKSAADARALFLKQNTVNSDNIIQFIDHNGTYAWEVVGRNSVFYIYNAAVSNFSMCINPSTNAVHFPGAVSKGSGTFNIEHPLDSKKCTHRLVHSFIEGPQADLIYRGKINLDNGIACINIDCTARMTEGTFEALNRCAQVFTTNESSWSAIRGKLQGNILVIESQNTESNDEISWMVIGERQDKHIKDTSITDSLGRIITEPEVEAPFTCTQ